MSRNKQELDYSRRELSMDEAVRSIRDYEYALVYMISGIKLCKTSDLPEFDWEECQEARFFSKDKELHLFEEDGSLQAVEVAEKDDKDRIVKKYQLANRFPEIGKDKLLYVYEYLSYDEDGQAYVSLTRLAGIGEV